jgi:glutathione S-transferase
MGCGNSQAKKDVKAEKVSQEEQKPLGPLKLYGTTASMNCVGALLIAVETRCGQLMETFPGPGGTESKEFLAMNPFHAVPTVRDGDICIAESNCILRYMGEKYAPHLCPQDKVRLGFVNWAMDRFSSSLSKDVYQTLYVCFGYAAAPENQAEASTKCAENLELYAKVFLKEKFIGGDKLSIADYKVAPFFYMFAHPMLKEKLSFTVPDRIIQFNRDFAEVCKVSKELGAVKQHLDKKYGSIPEMLTELSATVPIESSNQMGSAKGKIKILGVPTSMNCAGPIMLSMHAGIGEMEACIPGQDTRTDAHLKLNPFGGVPILADGDFHMGESSAILRYIEQSYAGKLIPDDMRKRVMVDWAIDRFSFGLYNDCVATIYVAAGFSQPPEKPEELEAAGKKASANLNEFADFFLRDGKFIGGSTLSIADFKVAPFFLAYSHELVKTMCFVEIPDRIAQFNQDFKLETTSSAILLQSDGNAIMEFLDSKMKPEPQVIQPEPELQEGMEEEAQQTVTPIEAPIEPEIQTTSVRNVCCGG